MVGSHTCRERCSQRRRRRTLQLLLLATAYPGMSDAFRVAATTTSAVALTLKSQHLQRPRVTFALRMGATAATSGTGVKARFAKLQNQSDIRGVSLPGVAGEPVTLSPVEAFCIGAAFAKWLRDTRGSGRQLRVGVGRDPRLSGPALVEALMGGITSDRTCAVCDVGLCTTPAMFKSCETEGFKFDAAIMVTASHLPANRNGLKFFTQAGGLDNAAIARVVALAADVHGEEQPPAVHPAPAALLSHANFLPVYTEQLKDVIRAGVGAPSGEAPLAGLRVVINAGNGMGGFMRDVLEDLGADAAGSLYLEPDGTFPNHLANPELPEATAPTVAAVLERSADLGIILDTDVDRSGLVDRDGKVLNRNRLVAAAASIALRDHPGSAIVTDSTTSNGLARFIEARGGHHLRYKKGYKNVIDKALELIALGDECWLAMETSGHAAFKENGMLDDGAYLAIKLLIELAKRRRAEAAAGTPRAGGGFENLLEGLAEPLEEAELRLRVKAGYETPEVYARTLVALQQAAGSGRCPTWTPEAVNHEGLRVAVDEGSGRAGWVMNRMSLHDPIVIFNAESEVPGGLAAIARALYEEVLLPGGLSECLDCSSITACMK